MAPRKAPGKSSSQVKSSQDFHKKNKEQDSNKKLSCKRKRYIRGLKKLDSHKKTKSKIQTKNCRVKEKDESVRIEKNKDSRTQ